MQRGRLAGRGGKKDAVLHGALFFQRVVDFRHSGSFLADCHIDTDHVLAFLIENGVHRYRGFPSLTIPYDQFPLSPAYGYHGVNSQYAGLQGDGDGLPRHNPGGLMLDGPGFRGGDRPLAVDGVSQGVDDPPQHLFPCGHVRPPAGTPDQIPFLQALFRAQQRAAHTACFQVHGKGFHTVFKFQKFAVHDVLKAINGGDAVADLNDGAGFAHLGLLLIPGDLFFQYGYDLFRIAVQSHYLSFRDLWSPRSMPRTLLS